MDEYPADIRCSNAHWMLYKIKRKWKSWLLQKAITNPYIWVYYAFFI